MNYISKPEDWDNDYIIKFGIFKKSIVLHSFRRYTDALSVLEKAKELVENENKNNDERFNSLDRKWRAKLKISETIPKNILDYVINQDVVNFFKIQTPLSTLLIYVDKMRKANCLTPYNRHTFLNNQVILFYKILQKTIGKYHGDVKNIKKKIHEIDLWNTNRDELKIKNPKLFDKLSKKYKTRICPHLKKYGFCNYTFKQCRYANHASELNLAGINSEKKLLQKNLTETLKKTKSSTTTTPWKYPKQNVYEQEPRFTKRSVGHFSTTEVRSKSAKRKKSVDINKLKINFHEI